ncbi:MAG: hypothetical protein K2V38_04995 [Gemmataceae bacterium]|nr:hypothetical protein [Gemmataceae bacterium]
MAEPKLIPVFIPALVVQLVHSEREKGRALTEAEVLAIRDRGACMVIGRSTPSPARPAPAGS